MLKYSTDKFELLTKTGITRYRAPEMLVGAYDEKADIWSIGVIAYQLITGRLPFEDGSEAKLVNKILNEEPDYDGVSHWAKELL